MLCQLGRAHTSAPEFAICKARPYSKIQARQYVRAAGCPAKRVQHHAVKTLAVERAVGGQAACVPQPSLRHAPSQTSYILNMPKWWPIAYHRFVGGEHTDISAAQPHQLVPDLQICCLVSLAHRPSSPALHATNVESSVQRRIDTVPLCYQMVGSSQAGRTSQCGATSAPAHR